MMDCMQAADGLKGLSESSELAAAPVLLLPGAQPQSKVRLVFFLLRLAIPLQRRL